MHQERGFSIIELMIALTILAILLGVATPNLTQFLVNQRVQNQASELINALAFARSEAGKLNTNIIVIPAINAATGWSNGWCLGPTTINDCTHVDVIKNYQPSATDVQISSTYLQAGNRLTFRRDGTLLVPGSATTFKVTSTRLDAESSNARCISLNGLGKASMTKVKPNVDC